MQRTQERLSRHRDDADLYAAAASDVLAMYRTRLDGRGTAADSANENRAFAEAERQLRLAGLKAERKEIFAQARSRRIDDQMARKLVRELDLVEARLAQD